MKKIAYILLVLVTSFSLFTLLRMYVEKEKYRRENPDKYNIVR